jgi:sarcosine oxidase
MEKPLDAIVLGLGAMGSAALYQLAKRGGKVLGIDRFSPPHALGSTHGDTRITRQAIGEGEQYTPLVLRSNEIWREIEGRTAAELLTVTGGLVISSAAPHALCHVPGFFDNTVAAARKFGIEHELLDAAQVRARFPQFAVRDNEFAYFEPGAGFLRPETCVAAQLSLAEVHGAAIRREEQVLRFSETGSGVKVETDRGTYRANRLVVTAGPWIAGVLDHACARHFSVTRQVLHWFQVRAPIERYEAGRFPVFIWELQASRQGIYGFPAIDGAGGGVKVASEQNEKRTTPEAVVREVAELESRVMYDTLVAGNLPDLAPDCVRSVACLYTTTPDGHFVIDRHPEMASVIIASPCSGHGFKHSAAIGESLAELALQGGSTLDLGAFTFSRLAPRPGKPGTGHG